jgi:hypothetical protein
MRMFGDRSQTVVDVPRLYPYGWSPSEVIATRPDVSLAKVPGFITGTSSEYLGQRPLRRIVRERLIVVIMGPKGSGKTEVARRIAAHCGERCTYLDTEALAEAVLHSVRVGRWAKDLIHAPCLVLDGPTYLHRRPGVVDRLLRLLERRRAANRQTIVCDVSGDGSVAELLARAPAGTTVVLGLRFPSSRSGRLRFARRLCDTLEVPRTMAKGTDALDPWGYDAVAVEIKRRKEQ